MEQVWIHIGIAAACGLVAALLLSRGWISAAVLGFLAAMPIAVFTVYMLSGGLEGAGFDASKLPEGSVSLLNVMMTFCLMFGVIGLAGGLLARVLKVLFGR